MRPIGMTIIVLVMMVAVASAQTAPSPLTFTKNVVPFSRKSARFATDRTRLHPCRS